MEVVRKHSRKRDAILDCIRSTKSHPSAEWVYAQLKPSIPELSLGTVYRNIAMFRSEKLLQSVGVVAGLERFDANTAPHVHFICERCGAVEDVETLGVPTELRRAAEQETGGEISGCSLTFTGDCAACRKAAAV